MGAQFFDLPTEIRLEIYALVFGSGKVVIEARDGDDGRCLLPRNSTTRTHSPRSSQLLRANKAILAEARPVLYDNTRFHVLAQSFAGKMPTSITDGHACAPYITHLIWQLDCDTLKHFDPADLRLDLDELTQWRSFEVRCRAETWRDSFLGEWCDREAFIQGRQQVLAYTQIFGDAMTGRARNDMRLIEDRSQLGLGRVMARVCSNCPAAPSVGGRREKRSAEPSWPGATTQGGGGGRRGAPSALGRGRVVDGPRLISPSPGSRRWPCKLAGPSHRRAQADQVRG